MQKVARKVHKIRGATLQTMPDSAVCSLQVQSAELVSNSAVMPAVSFLHNFGHISIHPTSKATIQAKVAPHTSGDVREQEADRVADEVTRPATSDFQGGCPRGGVGRNKRPTKRVRPGTLVGANVPRTVRVSSLSGRMTQPVPTTDHPLDELHPTMRNSVVQGISKYTGNIGPVQPKLAVDTPGDAFEQEADQVAGEVMRAPEPQGQRACACGGTCSSCLAGDADEQVHRKAAPTGESNAVQMPAVIRDVTHSAGRPLDASIRSFMEPRFGHDFSRVRIHTGDRADLSARSINALAYTVGSHIAFAAGRYRPESAEGRHLLAHELAHVVQQGKGTPQIQRLTDCTPPRLFGDECPPRERGETRRAHKGDMIFLDEYDPFSDTAGALIANFDIGRADIKPNLKTNHYWKQFIRKIEANRSHWKLLGFTDCRGDETKNSTLRQQRVQAVVDILPPAVQGQIDSHEGAHISQCIRDNTTAPARTLNRSVLLQLASYVGDFSSDPDDATPAPPEKVDTKNCNTGQREKLALAFRFAKMMVDKAISVIDHMEQGSFEEALLLKYFGKDALGSRNYIRRTYRLMQRDWDPNITLRCETAADHDECSSGTEGKTGVIPLLTNGRLGSLLICDSAFTTNVLPETDLPETILHEISHALEWTFDNNYCDRASGCALDTDEAIHNGDSYSGFAGEALSTLGPD